MTETPLACQLKKKGAGEAALSHIYLWANLKTVCSRHNDTLQSAMYKKTQTNLKMIVIKY